MKIDEAEAYCLYLTLKDVKTKTSQQSRLQEKLRAYLEEKGFI